MSEFKNPYQEDIEYCKKGTHLWIQKDDNLLRCYICGSMMSWKKEE